MHLCKYKGQNKGVCFAVFEVAGGGGVVGVFFKIQNVGVIGGAALLQAGQKFEGVHGHYPVYLTAGYQKGGGVIYTGF